MVAGGGDGRCSGMCDAGAGSPTGRAGSGEEFPDDRREDQSTGQEQDRPILPIERIEQAQVNGRSDEHEKDRDMGWTQ